MVTPDKDNGDVSAFEVGQRISGRVAQIENFGAFLQLSGNVFGLLLIPEISWDRIRHPSDVLQLGLIIEVEVLLVNREQRKVSVSLKRLVRPNDETPGS
jgi:ribosomal protein S1